MDEPAFTQPVMYESIYSKTSVPDSYAKSLEVGISFLQQVNSVIPQRFNYLI